MTTKNNLITIFAIFVCILIGWYIIGTQNDFSTELRYSSSNNNRYSVPNYLRNTSQDNTFRPTISEPLIPTSAPTTLTRLTTAPSSSPTIAPTAQERNLTTSNSSNENVNNKNSDNNKSTDKNEATTFNICDFSTGWGERLPSSWKKKLAYNIAEDKYYLAHPLLLALSNHVNKNIDQVIPFDPNYITEDTGLKVPYAFDCTSWANYDYYKVVPSRWTRCEMNNLMKNSAIRSFLPGLNLAIIDEELFEMLAVYATVLSAQPNATFRMIDVGARWGTWGARAIAYGRKMRPDLKFDLLFIEPLDEHCRGLRDVMAINNISLSEYQLIPSIANFSDIAAWIERRDVVDLVDMDIQGDENALVQLKPFMDLLARKVRRVIIGTHWTHELHSLVRAEFLSTLSPLRLNSSNLNSNDTTNSTSAWRILSDMPWTNDVKCVVDSIRSSRLNWPGKWDIAFQGKGCVHNTTDFGPIIQADGELVFENVNLPCYTKFCEMTVTS